MAIPLYNVGTATLTAGSTAMVGQGTLWLGNVRPGDQVVSYTGQTAIVGTVNSNTSITLLRAYRGTSQTAQAYEILYTPDDPFTQQLAREVLQGISASALVKLGGVTPAARKLVRFDASANAALSDLSDFALTLLDDADAAAAQTTLGGTAVGRAVFTAANATAGRSALELGAAALQGYEEVLFNPELEGLTVAGAPTYAAQQGRCIKVGKLVFCSVYLVVSAINDIQGQLRIRGLPYTRNSAVGARAVLVPTFWSGLNLGSGSYQLIGFMQDSGASARLYKGGQTNQTGAVTHSDVTSAFTLYATCSYEAAA